MAEQNTEPGPEQQALGRRIREARHEAKRTLQQVADHFGIAPSTVSRWETGEIVPNTTTVAELAEMFGCSAASVAFGDAPSTTGNAA
jgi:transcriptional regulator with XRE-family HTH domain